MKGFKMEEENEVIIEGKRLECLFCGNSSFAKIYTKLNKKWLSILDTEMFAPEGTAYICRNCGYKHEFFSNV